MIFDRSALTGSNDINWADPINREWGPNSGLVAMYLAQGNGGLYWRNLASKGNINTGGTLTNMAAPGTSATSGWGPTTRPGGFGEVRFASASTNYVNCGSNVASTGFGSADFAISAWIKPIALATTMIVAKDQDTVTTRQFFFNTLSDGTLQMALAYTGAIGNLVVWPSAGTISAGVWSHVVGQRVGDTFEIYINGKNANAAYSAGSSTGNFPATMKSLPCALNIGRREVAASQLPFNGSIDAVRIHNRALSAAEVAATYADDRNYCRRSLNRARNRVSVSVSSGGASIFRSGILQSRMIQGVAA